MKRVLGLVLFALALGAAGSPVEAQFFGSPPGSSDNQVQQSQINVQQARSELESAQSILQRVQRQHDAGTVSDAELSNARVGVARAQAQVAQREFELKAAMDLKQRNDQIAILRRPVSAELRDAPVRQAAQTLSQASGVTIGVDKGVPTDKRLTVVAQDVPLGTVLDTVARQTGLLIAPEGNGVLLKPAPSLEINGQREGLSLPFEPWTNEWGQNPTMQPLGFGGGFPIVSSNAPGQPGPENRVLTPYIAAPNGPPVPTTPEGAPAPEGLGLATPAPAPGFGGFGGGGLGGFGAGGLDGFGGGGFGPANNFAPSGGLPVTMTALSSTTFVVASPAPGGEPAVMLTVYRLEGTVLRKVSSTLHRLGPAAGLQGTLYGSPGGHTYVVPRGFPGADGRPGVAPRPGFRNAQPDTAPGFFPGAPREAAPRFSAPESEPRDRLAPVSPGAPDVPGAAGPLPRPDHTLPSTPAPVPQSSPLPREPQDSPSNRSEIDRVMILGAVQRPGTYPLGQGMRALDALVAAGGAELRADVSNVKVWHIGKPQTLDLRHGMGDLGAEQNPPLSSGDLVEVPLRSAKGPAY